MAWRSLRRRNPRPCSCGATYDRMRTGMTFVEVRRSMDPTRWKFRRRRSVLGYWREMKLRLWDDAHAGCS